MEFNRENVYSAGGTLQSYLSRVFVTMGAGLGITALVAALGYFNIMSGGWMYKMLANGSISMAFLVAFIVQIGLCISMGRRLTTMSNGTARTMFYVYAGVTGFTFSILPLEFGLATVFTAFAFAAVMFFACAVIGHYTNVDLSRFSGIMIGGLFALVLASVLALFIPSLRDGLVISYIGVILFGALTAWDMQRVKAIYYQTQGNEMLSGNLAVYGAVELYLDFINMFLYILRIVGSRSSSRN